MTDSPEDTMTKTLSRGLQPSWDEHLPARKPGERPYIYMASHWVDKGGVVHQRPEPGVFFCWGQEIDEMWKYMDELEAEIAKLKEAQKGRR